MSVSTPFIKRPIATLLLALGVLLLGWVSYGRLPLSSLPTVDLPTIRVFAGLPGASPETMASAVAAPLERRLGALAGLTEMTSISTLGSTQIVLQFDLDRSITAASLDVQAAINAASSELPSDLPAPPRFYKSNPATTPLFTIALMSGTLSPERIHDLAERIAVPKLSQIEGVSEVSISGAEEPAVRVRLDPDKLASLGLDWEAVRGAVAAAIDDLPLGGIDGPRFSFAIGIGNPFASADDFRSMIISWKGGAPVRLGDVGEVENGVANTRDAAWFGDRKAVLLTVMRQPGANLVETADRVRSALPTLREWLPPTVDVTALADRTGTIRASIDHMKLTLGVTVLLVVSVNAMFLRRGRTMLIPALAIPVSLAGTFAAMRVFGYGLDNLTLMALTVAVGFIVDDVIVMTENIIRHIDGGLSPWRAALTGSRQITFTVVAMTLSLVAAFIPIVFMDGVLGRFFQVFGVTLSTAVLVSAAVSLTLTPVLCAHWIGRTPRRGAESVGWLQRLYERSLDRVLGYRHLVLAVTLLLFAATVVLYGVVPKGFIPAQDTGLIVGWTEAPQDISFAAMSQRQGEVVRRILADPAVENVSSMIGGWGGVSTGGLFVTLKRLSERTDSSEQVIARLRAALGDLAGIATYLTQASDIGFGGRVSRSQYQVTLRGENIDELNRWALIILERLRRMPELSDVNNDQQISGLLARLEIDRDSAARLGITSEKIDQTLYNAFGQRQVATVHSARGQVKVVMEIDPIHSPDAEALMRIRVGNRDGSQVPLAAFSRLELSPTALAVAHDGHQPAVTTSFNVAPGVSLGRATEAILAAEAELRLPRSLRLSFEGAARAFRKADNAQSVLILTAILVIYIVLGILYESAIHPLTILSTLPSAGLGALLAVTASGTELNVITMIGIILLIGVVKRNAIIIIDFAINAERLRGMGAEAAIREACAVRFRPILMTSLSAFFGTLPLVVGGGIGSELRQPFGIAMIGGLAVSQLLTLYTVPVTYLWFDKLRSKRGLNRSGSVGGHSA